MESVRPGIGDLALCQGGHVGIVKRVTAQGHGRILYSGVKLKDGSPWQSVKPIRLGAYKERRSCPVDR